MPDDVSEDLFKNPNRFAKLILKEEEKKPREEKVRALGQKGGGKHKDKRASSARPDKNKKDALARPGRARVDPNKREKDRQIALDSGICRGLEGWQGRARSRTCSVRAVSATGINQALGGLRGTAMGDAGGAGGLGHARHRSWRRRQLARHRRSRRRHGCGTGGMGDVDLGGRGKGKYGIMGRTVTQGCLTQEVVLRVIARAVAGQVLLREGAHQEPESRRQGTTNFEIGPTGRSRGCAPADHHEQRRRRAVPRARHAAPPVPAL